MENQNNGDEMEAGHVGDLESESPICCSRFLVKFCHRVAQVDFNTTLAIIKALSFSYVVPVPRMHPSDAEAVRASPKQGQNYFDNHPRTATLCLII